MSDVFPGRLEALPPSSFARLASLLENVEPGAAPISLAVGDPKGEVPAFVMEAIAQHAARFGEYPPIQGTPDWQEAAAGWIKRRFGADLDPVTQILPLNGTREGLFLAPKIVTPEEKAGGRPVILLPNPFYQCYAAAILAAGTEPVYVRTGPETGFLPDYASLPLSVLERTVAAYFCSPSNPEGACAREAYWQTLFALADAYEFTVFADECYADIYLDDPPLGALSVRRPPYERLLTFHSLSKRSGLPGLRSGMVAGDAKLMARFRAFRNYAGPQVPLPIIAASAAAWRDEEHVAQNRARYAERFAEAERILASYPGFNLPQGSFFLWLEVGDGEAAALRLWREAGVRVLPGAYMGKEIVTGKNRTNPGFPFIRIALVNDLSTITTALDRVGEVLSKGEP